MAHSHAHDHDHAQENYFLEQIFTIALCGALGGVAIRMYAQKDPLLRILDSKFHPYVLAGGIVLLLLTAIRAVAVWRLAGEARHAHAHDHHHHGHDHGHHHHHHHHHGEEAGHEHCDHDHGKCDHGPAHAHGHDHSHDWAAWRYSVLLMPVVLYFLDLPREPYIHQMEVPFAEGPREVMMAGVPSVALLATPGWGPLVAAVSAHPEKEEKINITFSQLGQAAYSPETRQYFEGKTATLVGQFVAGEDNRRFSLTRYKMNCCAADAVPINAILMVNPSWQGQPLDSRARNQKWVMVTGRITFLKGRGDQYVSALIVHPDAKNPPNELVKIVKQPANPYTD